MVDTLLGFTYSIFFIAAALFMDFSGKARVTRKSWICFRIGVIVLIFQYINKLLFIKNYFIFWILLGITLIAVVARSISQNKNIKEVN